MARVNRTCKDQKELKATKKEKFVESNKQFFVNSTFKLSNDQIEARQWILKNDIIILEGKAGCGKTMLACYTALKALFDGEIERVILTRPMQGTEDMGYIPGNIEEKYLPWLKPIIENFGKLFPMPHINAMIVSKRIEMLPLQFTRGVTYDNAYVIIDEAQNLTLSQIKMCLTRIGEGSKIILCGDLSQIDLKKKNDSGFKIVIENGMHERVENMCSFQLTEEHRKKIVIDVLEEFKVIEDKSTNK